MGEIFAGYEVVTLYERRRGYRQFQPNELDSRVASPLAPDANIQRSTITIIATMFHHRNNMIEHTKLQTGNTQWWWPAIVREMSPARESGGNRAWVRVRSFETVTRSRFNFGTSHGDVH